MKWLFLFQLSAKTNACPTQIWKRAKQKTLRGQNEHLVGYLITKRAEVLLLYQCS